MSVQLSGIGKQKISYKDHSDIQFESLSIYIILAKKAISKFANQIYNGLATKMLKDEDAISSIANAIMMADWRWDENYQNDKQTKKTRYSYRNQCALWAIQTYATKDSKKSKKYNVYSLDCNINDDENSSGYNYTKDEKILNPEELLIKNEEQTILKNLINQMLDCELLTNRQRDYIKLYYFESYTFDKIGKKYGITREAVRQGLNKALEIIRGLNG